jgi:hypothetical protein
VAPQWFTPWSADGIHDAIVLRRRELCQARTNREAGKEEPIAREGTIPDGLLITPQLLENTTMTNTQDALGSIQIAPAPALGGGSILYAQATIPQSVSSAQFVDIEGLVLQLPPASKGRTAALLTLTVSCPYAQGNNFPGINFNLDVNGSSIGWGAFTYEQQAPESFGRFPYAMSAYVPLTDGVQFVEAQWSSVRESTGILDAGYASLAAVLG